MSTAMTWLMMTGLTLVLWHGRPPTLLRRQQWRPREVWLPPMRCGDARVDAHNATDRSKWMRVITNRVR